MTDNMAAPGFETTAAVAEKTAPPSFVEPYLVLVVDSSAHRSQMRSPSTDPENNQEKMDSRRHSR